MMNYPPLSLVMDRNVLLGGCWWVGQKRKEQYKYNVVVLLLLLSYAEFVRYRVVSSVSVWVCVWNMIDTEKNIISDYNEESKRKKQGNDIIKKTDSYRIDKIMQVLCWFWYAIRMVYSSSFSFVDESWACIYLWAGTTTKKRNRIMKKWERWKEGF